jgi:hypothetical protein
MAYPHRRAAPAAASAIHLRPDGLERVQIGMRWGQAASSRRNLTPAFRGRLGGPNGFWDRPKPEGGDREAEVDVTPETAIHPVSPKTDARSWHYNSVPALVKITGPTLGRTMRRTGAARAARNAIHAPIGVAMTTPASLGAVAVALVLGDDEWERNQSATAAPTHFEGSQATRPQAGRSDERPLRG